MAGVERHLNLMPLKCTWWKGTLDTWTLSFDFCTLTMACTESGKWRRFQNEEFRGDTDPVCSIIVLSLSHFLSPPSSPLLLSQRQIQPPLDFPSLLWEFFTWENPCCPSVKDQTRFQVT